MKPYITSISTIISLLLFGCTKYDFETYNSQVEIVMPSDCDCAECNCLLQFGGQSIKLKGNKNDLYTYNVNWSELEFDLDQSDIKTVISINAYDSDNPFGSIYIQNVSFEPGINYHWEPANNNWEELGKADKDQKRTDIDGENEACIIGKWTNTKCSDHQPETWIFNFDGTGVYLSPFCDDACSDFAVVKFAWQNNLGNSIDINVDKSRDCSASPSLYFKDDMNLIYSCETNTLTANNTTFQRE